MFQLRFQKSDWKLVGIGLVIEILLVVFMHNGHMQMSEKSTQNTMQMNK